GAATRRGAGPSASATGTVTGSHTATSPGGVTVCDSPAMARAVNGHTGICCAAAAASSPVERASALSAADPSRTPPWARAPPHAHRPAHRDQSGRGDGLRRPGHGPVGDRPHRDLLRGRRGELAGEAVLSALGDEHLAYPAVGQRRTDRVRALGQKRPVPAPG